LFELLLCLFYGIGSETTMDAAVNVDVSDGINKHKLALYAADCKNKSSKMIRLRKGSHTETLETSQGNIFFLRKNNVSCQIKLTTLTTAIKP